MFDKFKQMIAEATPEETQLAKGFALGAAFVLGFVVLGKVFPYHGDPANKDPWLGKPPVN